MAKKKIVRRKKRVVAKSRPEPAPEPASEPAVIAKPKKPEPETPPGVDANRVRPFGKAVSNP